jgi:WD40 repeat protein
MALPKQRGFCLVRDLDERSIKPEELSARDIPAAWRKAESIAGGRPFALYGPDRTLVRVGTPMPEPFAKLSNVSAIAMTRDAERLAVGRSGAVRVYSVPGAELIWERSLGHSTIDAIVVANRARWIIACSRSGELHILDREDGTELLRLADQDARALAISPDERVLAVAGRSVDLWLLPDASRLVSLDLDVSASMERARVVDDGTTGMPAPVHPGISSIAFANGGEHVVGIRPNFPGEIISWNARTGARIATKSGLSVQRLVLDSGTGPAFVRVDDEPTVIRTMDVPSLEWRSVVTTGAERIWDLRVTPDDRYVVAHDEETGIYVLDRQTGESHAWLDEFEGCAYVVRNTRSAPKTRRRKDDGGFEEDTKIVALQRWGRNDPGSPASADGRRYAALLRHHDAELVAIFDLQRRAPYTALAHSAAVASVWLDASGSRLATRDTSGRVYLCSIPNAPAVLE